MRTLRDVAVNPSSEILQVLIESIVSCNRNISIMTEQRHDALTTLSQIRLYTRPCVNFVVREQKMWQEFRL